jgi:carbon-monoxide dehydrogenase medium subunit
MPLLNMRLASPSMLIDLNPLTEMSGIEDQGDRIRIGAMTKYREIERSPLVADELPLLKEALSNVAHAVIRNRGTLGGSLAFGDPAAEMPAAALALDATVIAQSLGGSRRIPMDAFLRDVWDTALEPNEAIVAVEYPKRPPGESCACREFSRRHGDFALVGLMLVVPPRQGARAVVFGVGGRAFRVGEVEAWFDRAAGAAMVPDDVGVALREAVVSAASELPDAAARGIMAATLLERALPLRRCAERRRVSGA